MKRMEMVKARTEQLKGLSDLGLINAVIAYFENNATLPGQKALKDFALDLKKEFDGNVITGILSQVRDDIIEQFASLLVCEVKIKNVAAMNENRPNRDKEGTKASDLPMVLTDVQPVPVNVIKNSYEMPVRVMGGSVYSEDGMFPLELGSLPKGFVKNHRAMDGLAACVIVTDHSNGKFANMSYRMLIDLGQAAEKAA